MNRRRITYFSSLAAAGALALAACATPADTVSQPEPAETVTVEPTPEPTVTDYWPTDEPLNGGGNSLEIQPLGGTVNMPDGLVVTFTETGTGLTPVDYKPYTTYSMSVYNGGTTPYTPAVSTTLNYGPDGIPATQVISVDQFQTFQGVIPPGATQTVSQGWLMPEGSEVVVTVSTDYASSNYAMFATDPGKYN